LGLVALTTSTQYHETITYEGINLANVIIALQKCWRVAPMLCASLLWGVGYAREPCGVEAKLLISSTQTQQALAALHARKPSSRLVYLYDTDQLDLLSQGLIVRLRAGGQGDLTLKMRSNKKEACTCTSDGGEGAKCEADLVGSDVLTSYSIRNDWKGPPFPTSGEEVYSALTPEQLQVLRMAGISVDWLRVKRKVEIRSTHWAARPSGPLKKVTIELWEWPGGTILELSTKADLQKGTVVLGELRALAKNSGLSVPQNQIAKTSLVLHALSVSR
jgi:hypothetical protein